MQGTTIQLKFFMFRYIHQQMRIIRYNSHTSLRKLLHVLAPRCHPQGFTNTKGIYKHQNIIIGSIMPSIRIFKMLIL